MGKYPEPAVVPTGWQVADLDGDGRDDILWRDTDGTLGKDGVGQLQ